LILFLTLYLGFVEKLMRCLDYFDGYVSRGLKPIAVYKNSKQPIGTGWNQDWSVERWRSFFDIETDKYNIGILLGDIVDVEGDNPDACDRLERMIDGIPRPKYCSSKSVHNIFQNPDPNLTRAVIGGIEFRANLHQSVVPPSFHSDGCRYRFLNGSVWPVPPMPDELKAYYFNNRSDKSNKIITKSRGPKPKKRLKEGFKKTTCKICNGMYYIHKKRLALEVKGFREFNLPWMCHGCRELDMRSACRRIRCETEQIISNSVQHSTLGDKNGNWWM